MKKIRITIAGPKGAGKTQLAKALRAAFIRRRNKGTIAASCVCILELRTKK